MEQRQQVDFFVRNADFEEMFEELYTDVFSVIPPELHDAAKWTCQKILLEADLPYGQIHEEDRYEIINAFFVPSSSFGLREFSENENVFYQDEKNTKPEMGWWHIAFATVVPLSVFMFFYVNGTYMNNAYGEDLASVGRLLSFPLLNARGVDVAIFAGKTAYVGVRMFSRRLAFLLAGIAAVIAACSIFAVGSQGHMILARAYNDPVQAMGISFTSRLAQAVDEYVPGAFRWGIEFTKLIANVDSEFLKAVTAKEHDKYIDGALWKIFSSYPVLILQDLGPVLSRKFLGKGNVDLVYPRSAIAFGKEFSKNLADTVGMIGFKKYFGDVNGTIAYLKLQSTGITNRISSFVLGETDTLSPNVGYIEQIKSFVPALKKRPEIEQEKPEDIQISKNEFSVRTRSKKEKDVPVHVLERELKNARALRGKKTS